MTRRSLSRLLLAFAPWLPLPAPVLFDTDPPRPPAPVRLQRVLGGLAAPTSITHAGDGRLFITLLHGLVVIVEQGAVRPEPFLNVEPLMTESVPGAHSGEQGLLGIAFHPRYEQNGFFFLHYTDRDGSVVVARYRVSEDPQRADPASGRVLLTIPKQYNNHNGGQLQFGPDGYLYVSVGDGGASGGPSCFSQKMDSLFGKILRLDVDANADTAPFHGIPADNPFPGSPIWATGLRNPWRFSFDRLTGDLWIADVGQSVREEINVQPAGASGGRNYGWKLMEGSVCFSNASCPVGAPPCHSPALTLPVLEYAQGDGECSVTGGYVSRAPSLPHLWGAYFFGDLCSGRLWTAEGQDDAWDIRQIPQRLQGVTTFGEDRAGDLWLATYEGELYRIVPEIPIDTVGLYHPARARFLVKDLHHDGPEDRSVRFGKPGNAWLPVAGDWDGDGHTGIGFWDPQSGRFRLKNVLRPGPADHLFVAVAVSGRALPVAGDWDGDGKDSVGLYEPGSSTFRLTDHLAQGAFPIVFHFGRAGLPVAGDWDGDGRDSVGLYLPARDVFLLRNSLSDGPAEIRFRVGSPSAGWLPLAGDWDGDGKDSIGLYDPATGTFRLLDDLSGAATGRTVRFGTPGAGHLPLAGEW